MYVYIKCIYRQASETEHNLKSVTHQGAVTTHQVAESSQQIVMASQQKTVTHQKSADLNMTADLMINRQDTDESQSPVRRVGRAEEESEDGGE